MGIVTNSSQSFFESVHLQSNQESSYPIEESMIACKNDPVNEQANEYVRGGYQLQAGHMSYLRMVANMVSVQRGGRADASLVLRAVLDRTAERYPLDQLMSDPGLLTELLEGPAEPKKKPAKGRKR